MLVLSRQRDESIMIGDDVEIVIVDIRGNKVRLGITAPREIPVHRREVYDAIQREKAEKEVKAEEKVKAEKEAKVKEKAKAKKAANAQKEPEKVAEEQPEKMPQKQHK